MIDVFNHLRHKLKEIHLAPGQMISLNVCRILGIALHLSSRNSFPLHDVTAILPQIFLMLCRRSQRFCHSCASFKHPVCNSCRIVLEHIRYPFCRKLTIVPILSELNLKYSVNQRGQRRTDGLSLRQRKRSTMVEHFPKRLP